jgi:hypothetical protein
MAKRPRGRDWLDVSEESRKVADDQLARKLLLGEPCDQGEARAALARCIRDQMPGSFTRELLAMAIDPETKSRFIGMAPTRRIKFESVRRGQKSTWRRDLLIMDRIRQELGQTNKLEAAYNAVMCEYGISRATAQAIWKRHCAALTDASK